METSLDKLIEKQPGESDIEYAAFLFFAAMPPKERHEKTMVPRVAEYSGLAAASVWNARAEFSWFDRANLIDAHNWLVENQKRADMLSEDNAKFIQETREIKEKSLDASRKMLSVASNLLDSAELVDQIIETDHVITQDGRRVPTHTTIKMKAKISDIPRLVDTAVKVSRLASELPTEIVENDLAIGADLSQLSDEELLALRHKNHRRLIEKGAASKVTTTQLGEVG